MATRQQFFVTATGTDVGKTCVTSLLCKKLREQQLSVKALKPVASGWERNDLSSDVAVLLEAQGMENIDENIEAIAPYRYSAALSPDIAAQREGKTVPYQQLQAFCMAEVAEQNTDVLLIEGVGGVMSPLAKGKTNLDLIEQLNIPIILVIGNYLGSVSHTLTAISAMQQRNIQIFCVIVNENQWDGVKMDDTITIIQDYLSMPIYSLPFLQEDKEEKALDEVVDRIVNGA